MQLSKLALPICLLGALAIVGGKFGADLLSGTRAEAEPNPIASPSPEPSATLQSTPTTEAMPPVQQERATDPSPPPIQLAATLPIAVVKPGSAANLRAAASTQAAVLDVLMPGREVQVMQGAISQQGVVWYPVIAGELKGWVASSLLTAPVLPAQHPTAASEPAGSSVPEIKAQFINF